MKKINSVLCLLIAALAFVSCSDTGYKKTKSGLLYKISSSTKDSIAKEGNILKLNYIIRLGSNDSVIQSSYGKMPAFAKVFGTAPAGADSYNPSEVFSFVRKGDSVTIVQMVDTLISRNPTGMPPFLKKGDKLITSFKVLDVFTSEEAAKADTEAEMAKDKIRTEKEHEGVLAKGIEDMKTYLKGKNINATMTGRGTFVVVKEPGAGIPIDSGKFVTVMYTGRKISDNTEFDGNQKPGGQPFTFLVDGNQVIAGWDQGMKLFKKGGKGTIYVPGALAFGANPQPGSPFKPNEPIYFDIEIVDVSTTQPAPPVPQMPQMPDTTGRR